MGTAWQCSSVRHRFQCVRGHTWQAMPRKVINEGSWCRRCAQQDHGKKLLRQDGLARLLDVADRRGGKLLDSVYTGMHARYRFSCANDHQWHAEGAELVRGSWCRACANEDKRIRYRLPDGLARLHAASQAKQGVCLSPEYVLARTPYRFRCQQDHEWQAPGQRIFRGSWCPTCATERKRLSIDEMRTLARQRGGRCLSEHYKNSVSKLQWECHRGHQWHATPSSATAGHWCPTCAHFDQISNPRSKAWSRYVSAK
ncbi:MAG: uncharacterized protein JWQ80_3509 [Massilia sp.]|nr:uncharacterized protein [Massilia sp.]